MALVKFVQKDGTSVECDVENGTSLMEGALENNIPGIMGDCGGACACATCHVHVADEWMEKAGEANEFEAALLEFAEDVKENSRLCCQISASDELNGIEVIVPEHD